MQETLEVLPQHRKRFLEPKSKPTTLPLEVELEFNNGDFGPNRGDFGDQGGFGDEGGSGDQRGSADQGGSGDQRGSGDNGEGGGEGGGGDR